MKPLYRRSRRFWVRRKLLSAFRTTLSFAVIVLSLSLSLILLLQLPGNLSPKTARASLPVSGATLTERFDRFVTNRLSDALEGIRSIEKVYWLSDADSVAPKPDQSKFGETADPEQLRTLLEEAQALLEGQRLYFDPDRPLRPGSTVRYYLDETIFALTWKEIHNGCVYTCSEVKIAHPSQIRRFLADGTYGSGQQYLTTEMSESVNAVVASSGDFYAYRRFGAVVYNGQVYRSENGQMDLCFLDDRGDLQFLYAAQVPEGNGLQSYVDAHNFRFSLAFGPIIVDDYRRVTPAWYPVGEIDSAYSRAALCQMDTLHYLVCAANMETNYPFVPTLFEFARQIEQTGCRMAYTLDGGQTAAIAMNHTLINQVSYGSQRRISDILYFATAVPDGG